MSDAEDAPRVTHIIEAAEVERILRRMTSEIVERVGDARDIALVGIRRGGVPIARVLADGIRTLEGVEVPVGALDIALHRDDAALAPPDLNVGPSEIPFDVRGMDVVLVDDVVQTGRTVRAAIDALHDYGRPNRIWLAALLDRGGRELPIAPDFVGRAVNVAPRAKLVVEVEASRPGRVRLTEPPPRARR